ncbi:TetR-like C-terminal domain-containing protein [Companilactobacillus furfuricola]|uniref:TetR-like C-terminal domain-containing protein n=1 Tax=Companilactobacillus furfuricola TaxID=1462575 RepID=UPI000F76C75E|nr:TetR-like C-terminal domain-containing protein [Companilactobacillus furfuricola]
MEDFYFELFEKYIIGEITKGCNSYDELVVSVVDYILSNKTLCLNLANLSMILKKPDYLLTKFANCFKRYELPEGAMDEAQHHLLGGLVHTVQTWFEKDLNVAREEMIDQLIEQGDLLRTYLKN